MDTFNNYKRTDLIKLLRVNKQYLPTDVLKHTKDDVISILVNAKDLDLSLLETFVEVKTKTKNTNPTPLKTVQPVIKPPVVLDELSEEEEEEEVIRKPRLVRKKAVVPVVPVKVDIKMPVLVKPISKPVSVSVPVPVANNKEDETKVKELLKDYATDCRDLLDNYDDDLDDFDVQSLTETYNEIREDYENAIDDVIEGLKVPFSEKFYALISKMLDLSLTKIENFIK